MTERFYAENVSLERELIFVLAISMNGICSTEGVQQSLREELTILQVRLSTGR